MCGTAIVILSAAKDLGYDVNVSHATLRGQMLHSVQHDKAGDWPELP